MNIPRCVGEGPAKKGNITIPEGGAGQDITSWGRSWSRVVTPVISRPRVMQTVIPVSVDFLESMVLEGSQSAFILANFN